MIDDSDRCNCVFCSANRKYYEIVGKLDDPTDREWMIGFLDALLNQNAAYSMEIVSIKDSDKESDSE